MHFQEFFLELRSRGDQSALFQALRKLTLLEDPQSMMMADATDGDADVGWMVWNEPCLTGGSANLVPKAAAV